MIDADDRRNNVVISDKRIVAYYLRHGKKPIDIFLHQTTDAIMFVFDRFDTKKLYQEYQTIKNSNKQ